MAKILIVEDDAFLLKMYSKKFQVRGYEVDSATNGVDGIAKMQSFKPDIVLMDIMMPKLNGLEALDKIKLSPEIKNIPVIILTNLSSTVDAQTALSRGAVKYIIKSEYTPTQIVDAVEKNLTL